ncbi:MAG: RNA polymerase sigma factor [Salinivenus sp.]
MRFSSFEKQVELHEDHIFRYARSLLNDEATAQDVTQDVLITFWKHHEDLDGNHVLPWLLRVTRNACIDKLRRRQTRHKTMTVDTDGVSDASSPEPGPDAQAEVSDFQEHLHAALDRVDPPYRQVVELRELQELKYKEIAEALDMPLNTVKVYIHRGRKKLRRQLSHSLDAAVA